MEGEEEKNIEAQFGGPDRVWGNFAAEITGDEPEGQNQGQGDDPVKEITTTTTTTTTSTGEEESAKEAESDPATGDSPEGDEEEGEVTKSGSIFDDEDEETETAGVDEVEKPVKMSKTASESWDKLKSVHAEKVRGLTSKISEKDREIGALQLQVKEIETLRGKATVTDELQAKYDELVKEVALLDIRKSPEYKEAISKPKAAIREGARELIMSMDGLTESDVGRFLDVLGEPDPVVQRKAFKEFTSGWDVDDIADAKTMVSDARTVLTLEANMEQNSSAAYQERERIAAEKQADANRKAKEEIEGFVDQAAENFSKKLPFVALREGETAESRNAALAEKAKKVDWSSISAADKAAMATATIGLKAAVATIVKLQDEVKVLRSRVADKNASTPVIKESEGSPSAVEEDDFLAQAGFGGNNNIIQRLNVTL